MILYRYILMQMSGPVLSAFFSLNLLFLVIQLLKVAELTLSGGLGFENLVWMGALFLPGFAVLTIPIAALTGVLLGFSRMAADGELLALAGAGVSSFRLSVIPLFIGSLAAAVAGLVAAFVAPAANTALHEIFMRMSKQQVASAMSPGRFFEDIPGVVFYPREKGKKLDSFRGFLVYEQKPGSVPNLLLANRATVRPSLRENTLELLLEDGEIHRREVKRQMYTIVQFQRAVVGVDIDSLVDSRPRLLPVSERMSFSQLLEAQASPEYSRREQRRFRLAWDRRVAFPVASVLFGLLGAALGASGRWRGKQRTLVMSVLIVACYYMLVRLGDAMVDQTLMSADAAAWAPNLLIGLIGIVLLWRLQRSPG